MKSKSPTFTYQTRLNLEREDALNDYAQLMGRVERKLFAALM
jgi:hypothetical protein